jgi:hypothetical protein
MGEFTAGDLLFTLLVSGLIVAILFMINRGASK